MGIVKLDAVRNWWGRWARRLKVQCQIKSSKSESQLTLNALSSNFIHISQSVLKRLQKRLSRLHENWLERDKMLPMMLAWNWYSQSCSIPNRRLYYHWQSAAYMETSERGYKDNLVIIAHFTRFVQNYPTKANLVEWQKKLQHDQGSELTNLISSRT